MTELHNLLKKQINKLHLDKYLTENELQPLFLAISNSYKTFEKANQITEHAFSISEKEYQEINNYLYQEIELKQQSITEIKKAIKLLAPEGNVDLGNSSDDLIDIIKFLYDQINKAKKLENQLIQSKEVAEKAVAIKAQFLSTMSHEIRTPINAVIGFTNLLHQLDPKPEQLEYLQLLQFSAENLLVLINDILDFSKIEAGKIDFEEADFLIKDLIGNTRLALLQKAIEKNIQLKLFIDQDIPDIVKGDPVRIGQVLTNLISNAVKFTQNGKVTITATLKSLENDHIFVDFDISDTGIGIATEHLNHIFESFTQASVDTTRKFGGTGLGLTITKRLLELMGSQIKVKSKLGEGSSFYFTLKVKKSDTKYINKSNNQLSYDDKNLEGVKVLIAEDNVINAILAKQFMKMWKVDCDVAENGKEALKMIKNNDYDLVLMDLQMPELDGYQTTIEIRKLDEAKYKNLPIIAVTASAMLDIKDKAFQVGMNDYVSKPFNPNELYKKIAQYCKKAS
jgi:signal transduction histidine kinase/CheY-like chemotaxis protein